jgi:DNA gyrase inhibitor GyrI
LKKRAKQDEVKESISSYKMWQDQNQLPDDG